MEAISVQDLVGMRCLFALDIAAARLVYYLIEEWPPESLKWVRELAGKLGVKQDRDGPFIFLQGLVALYQTGPSLSFAAITTFPFTLFKQKKKWV